MSKIWIWTKIIFFALVLIYVLVFCGINHSTRFDLWIWYNKSPQCTALELAVGSFLAGVVTTLFIRTTLVTVRQLREMTERKRQEKLHRDVAEMKAKAAMLQPRDAESPDETSGKT